MDVCRVELCSSGVRVERIIGLVVTRLVECAKIIPNFRYVRVQADCARVSVESIAVLIDLVIQNTNRAPKSGVSAIAIDSLLVCLIGLWVLLLRHVATTEEVPALRVGLVCKC